MKTVHDKKSVKDMSHKEHYAAMLAFLKESRDLKIKYWREFFSDEEKWAMYRELVGLWTDKALKRFYTCGNEISTVMKPNGVIGIKKANFCKHSTLCKFCAMRRSIVIIREFLKKIPKKWLVEKKRYMLTLTIKHTRRHHLADVIDIMIGCREEIRKRIEMAKDDRYTNQNTPFSMFDGMIFSFEITKSGKNWYHPHFHVLACCDEEIDIIKQWYERSDDNLYTNLALQNEWKDITKQITKKVLDASKQIYYASDYWPSKGIEITKKEFSKNVKYSRYGFGEVFKYPLKMADMAVKDSLNFHAIRKQKWYRLLTTRGVFRGKVMESEKKIEEAETRNSSWGVFQARLGEIMDILYEWK
jgi:plasmid rolling circle replication initiator protein Rep